MVRQVSLPFYFLNSFAQVREAELVLKESQVSFGYGKKKIQHLKEIVPRRSKAYQLIMTLLQLIRRVK